MHTVRLSTKNHWKLVSLVGGSLVLFGALVSFAMLVSLSTHAAGVNCPVGTTAYQVVFGDTLDTIAMRSNTTWQTLSASNHLANADLIFPGQTLCVPGGVKQGMGGAPLHGPGSAGNFYPQGQCTFWADARYFQLHNVFVPWTTNADAWRWSDRAHEFHWVVDMHPKAGDIIDLQPGVQLASNLGHVGIVENVLANGDVLTSNLNWGAHPGQVAYVQFSPGAGVTFIREV